MAPPFFGYRSLSAEQVVSENTINRHQTILPATLFTFSVGASIIGNWHLINPAPFSRELGGEFRLEAKAILLDLHAIEQLATKHLITGFHIREIEIRKHVR